MCVRVCVSQTWTSAKTDPASTAAHACKAQATSPVCAKPVTPASCVRRVSLGLPFKKCLRSFSSGHWGSGGSQRKFSRSKPPANLALIDCWWNWSPPGTGISETSAVHESLYLHEMRIHVNTRHLFSETGHVYREKFTDVNPAACIRRQPPNVNFSLTGANQKRHVKHLILGQIHIISVLFNTLCLYDVSELIRNKRNVSTFLAWLFIIVSWWPYSQKVLCYPFSKQLLQLGPTVKIRFIGRLWTEELICYLLDL